MEFPEASKMAKRKWMKEILTTGGLEEPMIGTRSKMLEERQETGHWSGRNGEKHETKAREASKGGK